MTSNTMLLRLLLILFVKSVACFDEEEFITINESSAYCSLHKVYGVDEIKLVCNLQQKEAYLDNSSFADVAQRASKGKRLELEINNCSRLSISSDFQSTWRTLYSSLYLSINDAQDVFQEEILLEDAPNRVSDFISVSMKNVKMASIDPYLMSDTKVLMVDIADSNIGVISTSTFQNVDKIWQLRICRTNISQLKSDSMPEYVSIATAPEWAHVQWPPFIFNETHIEYVEANALKFFIAENSGYFNIIHSHIRHIQSGGIRLIGVGHVVIADSVFHSMEDDALTVNLLANSTVKMFNAMNFPTLTIMSLEIFQVNTTNFIGNFQVENGKVFLMGIGFRFAGMLQPVIENYFRANSSASTYIDRMLIECDCEEMARSNLPAASERQLISEVIEEEHRSATAILDGRHNLEQLHCYVQQGAEHVNIMEFQEKYCADPPPYPSASTPAPLNLTDAVQSTDNQLNANGTVFLYSMIAAGVCGSAAIVGLLAFYFCRAKKKRGPYYLRKEQRKHKPNSKHVGVISENPICEEEAEDDAQL